jgi:hypothetical protein
VLRKEKKMNNIEKKLTREATKRIKHLISARDMDTIKLLWKMCAYIAGDEWGIEFAESEHTEKEMCDRLNKYTGELLEPYYRAHANRMNSEFFKGMREGIKIGVDLANEEKESENVKTEPKKDYAKAVERFYKAMEEDDQNDD